MGKLDIALALLPLIQVVLLGGVTWVLRELVVRQGAEETRRARELLRERLNQAYGPINHVMGEVLYGLKANRVAAQERMDELRALLRAYGHLLRSEHYQFCTSVLAGSSPSEIEIFWHRRSMATEIEKLKYLLHGSSSAMELSLTPRAWPAVRRWVARALNYLIASAAWILLFLAVVWVAFQAGERTARWLWLAAGFTLVLAMVREWLAMRGFRKRFSPYVLRPAKKGDRGAHVKVGQIMLQVCGFGLGPSGSDGVFGKETERAVSAFQRQNGLQVTGRLDARTRVRLYAVARGKDLPPHELTGIV